MQITLGKITGLKRDWTGAFVTAWRIIFADACVSHLARMRSDHGPILIKLQPDSRRVRFNTPFRFHVMWMERGDFKDFVHNTVNTWSNTPGNVMNKTQVVATSLSDWYRSVFGNIFKQKKEAVGQNLWNPKEFG